MADLSDNKYNLTREQFAKLIDATLKKIRNAGNVSSPEARFMFAIFETAVDDALQIGRTDMLKSELDANRNSARRFLAEPLCAHYLGLIGIDYEWAMGKISRLMKIEVKNESAL